MISKDAIAELAAKMTFGKPLITNNYRSVIAEAIVATAIPDWRWCSEDYAPFDFLHEDGTRLEVKQSSMRQSWATSRPSIPRWDIKPRKGYWQNGATWIAKPGRNADIYVLCLHAVIDDNADHRDATQWSFYVVPTIALPTTQQIGLSSLKTISESVGLAGLREHVEAQRLSFMSGRQR